MTHSEDHTLIFTLKTYSYEASVCIYILGKLMVICQGKFHKEGYDLTFTKIKIGYF